MPLPINTQVIGPVPVQTTFVYSGVLTIEDGKTPIPAGSLTTLELTLVYIDPTGARTIINNRSAQSILNANGVTYDSATGKIVWTSDPLDSPIIQTNLADGKLEVHQATIEWTWNSGTKIGKRKLLINVEQYAADPN